jgi:hypothetical protein
MNTLQHSHTASTSLVNSRRVVEDAIDRSKVTEQRTWRELTRKNLSGVEYPAPRRELDNTDDLGDDQ